MLLDEREVIVRKYPEWITDRDPTNDELEDRRKDFGLWLGKFLVSAEGSVQVDYFRRLSRRKKGQWNSTIRRIDGWMPLPEPVKE